MDVSRKNAIALLNICGLETASKMTDTRLSLKLNKLSSISDGEGLKGNLKKGYDACVAAIERKDKIKVVNQSPESKKKKVTAEKDVEAAEERATSKKKKKKAEGKKKVAASNKKTRLLSVMEIIKQRKKITLKELVQKADQLYVESGGKSNIDETRFYAKQLTQALASAELVVVEDGTCHRKW